MNYNKSYIVLAFIFFITILVFLIFITSNQYENPNLPAEPNYKILDGKPDSFFDKAQSSSEQINPASPTVTPMALDTILKPLDNQFVFHIVDALGEAVNEGKITINEKPFSFKQGLLTIEKPETASMQIAVVAEGYANCKTEFPVDAAQEKNIVLEYLLDFEILVTDQKNVPVKDAKVHLWKGQPAERPLQDNCLVSIWARNYSHFSSAAITRMDGIPVFSGIDKPLLASEVYFYPEDNFAYPVVGDKIHSIGATCWDTRDKPRILHAAEFKIPYVKLQQNNSQKLRIWDTLYLSGNKNHEKVLDTIEKVEYIRSNDHGYYLLMFPESALGEEIAVSETNKDGRSNFKGLMPALYYVQAQYENQWSNIIPLHPSCGGATLTTCDHCIFTVSVVRKNTKSTNSTHGHFVKMDDVQVRLTGKSETNPGVLLQKTSQGYTRFPSLKYGKYDVEVFSSGLLTAPVKKEVVVTLPKQDVVFELENWLKYTVSGTVVTAEQNEPVAGYSLGLRSGPYMYDTAITGPDGQFVFQDVPPGSYELFGTAPLDLNSPNCKFLPKKEESTYSPFLSPQPEFSTNPVHISVAQDVKDILFTVTPLIATAFSGKVMNPNGSPASQASVGMLTKNVEYDYSEPYKAYTIPSNVVTDSQGNFSFKLASQEMSTSKFEFTINAKEEKKTDPYWKMTSPNTSEFIESESIPIKIGTQKVVGTIGQTFSNIVIVLSDIQSNDLYMKMNLEQGEDINEIGAKISQNSVNLPVEYLSSNALKVGRVSPGNLEMFIRPEIFKEITTPYGNYKCRKYLFDKFQIEYPADKKELYIDYNPKKGVPVWGVCMGEDQAPVNGIYIDIDEVAENPNKYEGNATTDKNGFFTFSRLFEPKKQYKLTGYSNDNKIFETKPFYPPKENYKIIISK